MHICLQSSKKKSFINSRYPESSYKVNNMDYVVSVLAKLLLIYSTGQQNNSAVNLISRVLLSEFVTHKDFFVQIIFFTFACVIPRGYLFSTILPCLTGFSVL